MELVIQMQDQRQQHIEQIRSLLALQKRLLIWGNGEYSRIILDYLRENGIQKTPLYLVDDAYLKEESADTISISSYFLDSRHDDVIVFGFYDYGIILEKRAAYGEFLPHLFDFQFAVVNGQRLSWDMNLANLRLKDYRETFSMLEDDNSKMVMQRYLNAAISGEFDSLYRDCRIPQDYFNEITKDTKPDTLIDCGAFDGDSIHDFIQMFPGFRRLIAFEPDPDNVARISKREKEEHIRNLTLFKMGVYSVNKVLNFNANGESNAFFSGSGETSVEVIRLDDIRNMIEGTAFLKMDIEGFELDALKGATLLIRDHHPILAICVYHKESDLIAIPRFIRSIVGDGVYRYYLGYHGKSLAELCFYAIPITHDC